MAGLAQALLRVAHMLDRLGVVRIGYHLNRAQRGMWCELQNSFQVCGRQISKQQQQQLAIARALVTRPRLLILDEPTEGIQPSIIKDIGRVIRLLAEAKLAEWGDMAVVLVEQYFDFAKELADDFAVMDRGEVVLAGQAAAMVEDDVRRYLTV